VLGLWWLFVAARQPLPLGILLAGYGLPDLLSRIAFFLPGGLGVIEGGMIGLYAALGVPTTRAVLVVLAFRGLSFWLPTLLGFPVAAQLERKARRGKDVAR
jgi:glycosyltransferase 2 family protein